MYILNNDVLRIIIGYLGGKTISVYLLNFVSKMFNALIKTMGFNSKSIFNSHNYEY